MRNAERSTETSLDALAEVKAYLRKREKLEGKLRQLAEEMSETARKALAAIEGNG